MALAEEVKGSHFLCNIKGSQWMNRPLSDHSCDQKHLKNVPYVSVCLNTSDLSYTHTSAKIKNMHAET